MKQENGKKIPEKDDIYKSKKLGITLRIVWCNDYCIEAYCLIDGKRISFYANDDFVEYERFFKEYKYLGKAKNPLESIFEVEE